MTPSLPPIPLLCAAAADGRTALHLAAAGGHAGVASLLLQKGAWAEAEDSGEDTPLHAAAKRAHADVAEALLRHGVQVDRRNKAGLTAAGEALLRGHVDVAQQLAQWGAALEERPRGFSLLHLAAGLGRGEAVAWLLTCGADANGASPPRRPLFCRIFFFLSHLLPPTAPPPAPAHLARVCPRPCRVRQRGARDAAAQRRAGRRRPLP